MSNLQITNELDQIKASNNSFNFLRFMAAMGVLYYHCYPLKFGAGTPDLFYRFIGIDAGNFCVSLFFILSGFLISRSFENNSPKRYCMARAKRIFPALWLCVIFTLLMGAILTSFSLIAYVSNIEFFKYVFKSSTLLLGIGYFLPGIFIDNPIGPLVNGSLWTLQWELWAYLITLILGIFFRKPFTKKAIHILGLSFCIVWHISADYMSLELPLAVPLFESYFTGALYYFFRDKIKIFSGAHMLGI